MNTCGACKHWGEPITDASNHGYRFTPPSPEDADWRIAAPGEPWPVYRNCKRIFMREDDEVIIHGEGPDVVHPPGQSAYVQDGSDYYAELRTTENFGCLLWEAP